MFWLTTDLTGSPKFRLFVFKNVGDLLKSDLRTSFSIELICFISPQVPMRPSQHVPIYFTYAFAKIPDAHFLLFFPCQRSLLKNVVEESQR